jgi:Magnesium transporter NIPA
MNKSKKNGRSFNFFSLTNLHGFESLLIFTPSCQDWDRQNPTQIVTEMCGFVTILSGTFLLHKTKDMAADGMISNFITFLKVFFFKLKCALV